MYKFVEAEIGRFISANLFKLIPEWFYVTIVKYQAQWRGQNGENEEFNTKLHILGWIKIVKIF